MAVSDRRKARVQEILQNRLGSVVVVAEAVHRRHNTSAILRSAEAFGLHEVHMVTGRFRPSHGAARGAERWLELVRHPQLRPCVEALRTRGFAFWIADLSDDAKSPEEVPVDQPVAVLFGAELTGVSDEARSLADGVVSVPMRGLTTSLNVSAAAACTLHRISERRRALVGGGDLAPERQKTFFEQWLAREMAAQKGMKTRTT
jgi:tRNA (guanosine-2'-O-)-methyltransferase